MRWPICDHRLTRLTGEFAMPLQDLTPINDQLADIIVRAGQPWIETDPGMAWMKVLWTGPETGRWVALFRWKKGYVAAPHKHLSDAHTYILKGKLQVRDGVLEAGDYDYEPNGVLHGATTALEDTEYLFVCEGPVLFYNADGLTHYLGWEELQRAKDSVNAVNSQPIAISASTR
jgi:quercetin dioxygenase-like cupin family protein